MVRKLGLATAVAVTTTAGVVTLATPAVSVELRFASSVERRHVMNRKVFEPWAKEVSKMSGGALTIRMHYDGMLGKDGAGQFKRAVDGVADITWGSQGYTANLFRKTMLIELPGVSKDPVDATKRMWKVFDRHLASEYDGVKVIAIWALDAPIIHTKLKRVRKISALNGMRIRAPSQYQAWLIGALGATPTPMPAAKIYDSLDRRVIDGVLISVSRLIHLKLDEVTKFHNIGIVWGGSPFFAVMNKRSYRGLTKAHRTIIDRTSGLQLSIKAAQVYSDEGNKGLGILKADRKRNFPPLFATEVAKADALLKRAEADIIARVRKEGVDLTPALIALRRAGG